MGIQNPFEPKSGNNSVVDALIGNAYEVVKYVAYYVKEIRYVAENMADVHRVSTGMYENVLLTTVITNFDQDYEIDLPEGVTALMVINTGVNVVTADGAIYGASAENFSWVISDGKLVVSVPADPPYEIGSEIRWLINWQSPVVIG